MLLFLSRRQKQLITLSNSYEQLLIKFTNDRIINVIKMKIMEKWQWEVCKMFMYMAFPVAMFHYFNSPQIFEEEVNKIKLENFPTISSAKREQVEEMIREVNAKRELKNLQRLQESHRLKA